MAVDRKPEPPRTLAEWQTWAAKAKQYRADWLPKRTDAFWPRTGGSCWSPVAEDHPFKGERFCWRCITKASGWKTRSFAHTKHPGAICWKPPTADRIEPEQAARDDPTEDGEQDSGQAREVRISDPSRPALASREEVAAWWDAGRRIVSEDRPLGLTDTGQGFWPPIGTPAADFRDSWPPSWTDFDPTRYPAGWCAPSNYAPAAEPVQADQPERTPFHDAQSVEAHPAEDADRQPGTDEAP